MERIRRLRALWLRGLVELYGAVDPPGYDAGYLACRGNGMPDSKWHGRTRRATTSLPGFTVSLPG